MLKLNQEFMDAFIESVRKTLEIQCSTEASPLKWFIRNTKIESPVALTGIVGIASAKFDGNVNLSFPEGPFLGIINKMLDEKFEHITPDLASGAAELLNIIYGNAKHVLNTMGYQMNLAIPTVVLGNDIHVEPISKDPILVIPFQTEFGKFYLEIIEQSEENSA